MSDKYLVHESVLAKKHLLVENLLLEKPRLSVLQDEDQRTPLHWACSINDEPMVDLILKYLPQNTDLDELVDASGWTPVHITSSIGNVGILNKLMKLDPTPDINLKTNQGTTALHLSISKQRNEMVKELIEIYKCLGRIRDSKSMTPLHRASCIGSIPIILLLVDQAHVNVNAQDSDGWTSLHHAMAEGHGDAAVKLVELGADPLIQNNDGLTAQQVAVDESVLHYFQKLAGI